jgi:hypothetical protein
LILSVNHINETESLSQWLPFVYILLSKQRTANRV